MKISDIKQQQRNKDRFSVYVEGKYSFSLNTNDLLSSKIKTGDPVDEIQIEHFKQKSSDSLLLARAYDKCLRRPHSEKEIRDYLWKHKAGDESADFIIEKCYKLRLLDDELFAEKWVTHRRKANKSNRFIQNELHGKGIAKAIIESAVQGGDTDELVKLIEKKRSRYPDEKKLIMYLQRQGFSYSDIKSKLKIEED